jgi:hypothetical protein
MSDQYTSGTGRAPRMGGQPGDGQQGGEPSIGELFSRLASDTQRLFKQEVNLAKTEVAQAASDTGKAIAKLAAGALILYAGFMLLLWAAIFGLREAAEISWWASALIVGGATLLVGLILVLWARGQMKQVSFKPEETIDTLKDDRAWAKGQLQ